MQSNNVRPLNSVEYFLRVSAWLLALSAEEFMGAFLKLQVVQGHANHYGVLIALTAVLCIGVQYLGPFPVVRDLQELCFYDVLVQMYGLAIYLAGVSYSSYLVLAIAVYLLKFIRLIWWGRNLEGELLCEWPIFGVVGLFAKDRINEAIAPKQRAWIYATIGLTIVAAYFVWLLFTQVPHIWFIFLGILPVVALTKRAATDIQRRDEERIAAILELERTKLLAEFNADAAARNEDLRGATHDLASPIWAMSYTARDIVECTDLESAKEIAQNMEAGLRALTDLIVEVVEMARLGTKLKTPLDEVIFLPGLCRDFAKDLRPLAQQLGVTLGFDAVEIAVKSNKWLLQRIIHNLLMNAIVHAKPGKKKTRVKLSLHRKGEFCHIRVCDSGPGIPDANGPDRADNFKNLVYTMRNAKSTDPDRTSRKVTGHGLGLSGVMRMSNTLGLEITMKSRVGLGTMFHFKVPIATLDDLPDF